MYVKLALLIGIILTIFACEQSVEEINVISNSSSNSKWKYNIEKESSKSELGLDLKEISGLSFNKSMKNLLCVNDEEGRVFILDEEGREVIKKIPFGKKGDYEGIEVVGNSIFVVKSSGTILELDTIKQDVKYKYNTSLKPSNDVEGLGFNKVDSTLLLACKADAGIDIDIKDTRAIYKFDLKTRTLLEDPFLMISDENIITFLRKHAPSRENDKQSAYFKKLLKRAVHFSPSAIGVHPISNHIYIVSAVSKLLMVIDHSNKIHHFAFLKSRVFTQPEGICFSENGDMLISNEGAKGKANICVFKHMN